MSKGGVGCGLVLIGLGDTDAERKGEKKKVKPGFAIRLVGQGAGALYTGKKRP